MELGEYLAAIGKDPWSFPAVDGCTEPPNEWIAAAWELDEVQGSIAANMARDVSKMGEIFCEPELLEELSAALETEQVVRLYSSIRNLSPHREVEFRTQFEQEFARHAAALPPHLTQDEIVSLLGGTGVAEDSPEE